MARVNGVGNMEPGEWLKETLDKIDGQFDDRTKFMNPVYVYMRQEAIITYLIGPRGEKDETKEDK